MRMSLPLPLPERADGLSAYACGVCIFLACVMIPFTLIGLPTMCDVRYAVACALGAGATIACALCVVVVLSVRMYYEGFVEYDPEADEEGEEDEKAPLI
jgi:hypothetical protein